MIRVIVSIQFDGAFHVGEPGIGVENCTPIVRSDTLFAAIVSAWRVVYGQASLVADIGQYISGHDGLAPFRVSSAFPRIGTELFLPRPFLPPPRIEGIDRKRRRRDNAELSLGHPLIGREPLSTWFTGKPLSIGQAEATEGHQKKLEATSRTMLRPSVVLDRITFASSIYYRGEVRFSTERGLFFFLEYNDDFPRRKLEQCFDYLGENGLGGERGIGLGANAFTIDGESPVFGPTDTDDNDGWYLLSLFNPSGQDWNAGHLGQRAVGYSLVQRGGWSMSPDMPLSRRRLPLTFFAEGSVFLGQKPCGRLVDVNPIAADPHPIWKNGMAVTIPVSRLAWETSVDKPPVAKISDRPTRGGLNA